MADHTTGGTRLTRPDTGSLARIAVIGAFGLVLAVILVGGVWLTAKTLALLFAAIVIAEALAPLMDRMGKVMPRGVAVAVLYLGLAALLSGLVWYLAPTIVKEAQQLADEAPSAIERLRNTVKGWDLVGGSDILSQITSGFGRFTDLLIKAPMMLVSSAFDLVLVAFMSAYWQLSRSSVARFLRSAASREDEHKVQHVLEDLSDTVGGFVRGELISALLIGTIVYIGLMVIGVKYALVLALVAAFGELIPVLGPVLAAVPPTIIAFLESPSKGLIVLVFYVVVQQIESNIIIPNVMDQQADIPPMLVIVALSAGAGIGGILGALIAIPLAGVLKVLVIQVVMPFVRRWTDATRAPTTVEQAQSNTEA